MNNFNKLIVLIYLGVKLWYTGNIIHAVKALDDQPLKHITIYFRYLIR